MLWSYAAGRLVRMAHTGGGMRTASASQDSLGSKGRGLTCKVFGEKNKMLDQLWKRRNEARRSAVLYIGVYWTTAELTLIYP